MEFELTKRQIEIAQPYLDIAVKQAEKGEKGVVIAQIARMNSGRIMCMFDFMPNKPADKIIKIIQDFEKGE